MESVGSGSWGRLRVDPGALGMDHGALVMDLGLPEVDLGGLLRSSGSGSWRYLGAP